VASPIQNRREKQSYGFNYLPVIIPKPRTTILMTITAARTVGITPSIETTEADNASVFKAVYTAT